TPTASTVVLPARDVDAYLEQDLEYVRDWSAEANVVIASSERPTVRARSLAQRFGAVLLDSDAFLEEALDPGQIEDLMGRRLKRSKGKGLDLLSGILLAYAKGASGVYLMDTDFRSFNQYRPLHKLSSA